MASLACAPAWGRGRGKVTRGLWTLTGCETHGQHAELGALS